MNDDDDDDDFEEREPEEDFEAAIIEAISETEIESIEGADVESFADAGIMTTNRGVVVRMRDGSEFQVTIVQSRRARS